MRKNKTRGITNSSISHAWKCYQASRLKGKMLEYDMYLEYDSVTESIRK